MIKKLVGIAVIAIMLFGIFGFTACDNIGLDDYKMTKTNELQDYANAKGQEKYSTDGWAAICNAVTDGKTEIGRAADKLAVDSAAITAKNKLNAILSIEDEMADFILTISVDKNTKQQGKDFLVEVTLTNKSGTDLEIAYGYTHNSTQSMSAAIPLFQPQIEGWKFVGLPSDAMPGEANFATIIDNGYYNRTFELGKRGLTMDFNEESLSIGTHELRFCATFSLDWGTENQQEIEVWSNAIMLIVR